MKHLKENNETYFSHFIFAGKMSLHLLVRSCVFMFHAVLPWIELPESLNLDNTCKLITKWNKYANRRKKK